MIKNEYKLLLVFKSNSDESGVLLDVFNKEMFRILELGLS